MSALSIIFVAASVFRGLGYEYAYLKALADVTGSVLIMAVFEIIGERTDVCYRFLSFSGKITIFIYILHPIVLSGVRVILSKLGIENAAIWMVILMLLGYIIPICYYFIGQKIWILDAVFRPRRYLCKK